MVLAQGKRHLDPKSLMAGTRLYRVWRGSAHEVLALAEGYSWQVRTYKSLSEVARAITGTRWSGPRFFGVKVKNAVKGMRHPRPAQGVARCSSDTFDPA